MKQVDESPPPFSTGSRRLASGVQGSFGLSLDQLQARAAALLSSQGGDGGGIASSAFTAPVIAVPVVAVANALVRYTAQVSRRQPWQTAHDPVAANPNPATAS